MKPRDKVVRVALSLLVFPVRLLMCVKLANAQTADSTYKAKRAACHGRDGKLGVFSFAWPEVQKETDGELVQITAKGRSGMPAYGKSLTDAQIKGLVACIRDLAKTK